MLLNIAIFAAFLLPAFNAEHYFRPPYSWKSYSS